MAEDPGALTIRCSGRAARAFKVIIEPCASCPARGSPLSGSVRGIVVRRIPLAEFLDWFSTGAIGHIVRLQTTFMEIALDRPDLPPLVRIIYHSKRTFRLRHGPIKHIRYVREHPMLTEFNPKSDGILFIDDAYVIGKGFTIETVDVEAP